MRSVIVISHRYLGLLMAGFLTVAGATGSLLAWNDELEALILPQLFHIPTSENSTPLDLNDLETKISAHYPNSKIIYAPLRYETGHAVSFFISNSENNQLFLNPYTGELLGKRKWGDISQGVKNFMPFIYRLHYSLAFDEWGKTIMGIVALCWTVDCFFGTYLTFPITRKPSEEKTKIWFLRWLPAWKIRFHSSRYKINFDLHRAGGLWTWFMLFVFAWSSVCFNLPDVYHLVMPVASTEEIKNKVLQEKAPQSITSLSQARSLGQVQIQKLSKTQNIKIFTEENVFYDEQNQQYRYNVLSHLDISHEGQTALIFDANTGQLLNIHLPTGNKGDSFTTWITSLHTAHVFGKPMQIIICLMGIIVMMLSYTGIVIWWKKRVARTIKK